MTSMTPAVPELVNPIPADEVPRWARAMTATFLSDPEDASAARRVDLLTRGWDPARAWGARDRGRWVATLRSEPRRLSVPGVDLRTGDPFGRLRAAPRPSRSHLPRGSVARERG
jgi:GNAT acetyltransferase-like protein